MLWIVRTRASIHHSILNTISSYLLITLPNYQVINSNRQMVLPLISWKLFVPTLFRCQDRCQVTLLVQKGGIFHLKAFLVILNSHRLSIHKRCLTFTDLHRAASVMDMPQVKVHLHGVKIQQVITFKDSLYAKILKVKSYAVCRCKKLHYHGFPLAF